MIEPVDERRTFSRFTVPSFTLREVCTCVRRLMECGCPCTCFVYVRGCALYVYWGQELSGFTAVGSYVYHLLTVGLPRSIIVIYITIHPTNNTGSSKELEKRGYPRTTVTCLRTEEKPVVTALEEIGFRERPETSGRRVAFRRIRVGLVSIPALATVTFRGRTQCIAHCVIKEAVKRSYSNGSHREPFS